MNRVLLLPLLFIAVLLSACGASGPTGTLVSDALSQPQVGGTDYRGEVLACANNVGRKRAGKTTVPVFDCDFHGFYKQYPDLLKSEDWAGVEDEQVGRAWVQMGDAPLLCLTSLTFPGSKGADARRGASGAACDWVRWHAALELEHKPVFSHLKKASVTGVPYRGEALPCAVDVLSTNDSFWGTRGLFSCDFEAFYESYPELRSDASNNDRTTVDNVRFARWVKMGDGALYCLNSFRYDNDSQSGAACDWTRWRTAVEPR